MPITCDFGYYDYGEFLKTYFPDFKVQKIAINAGFVCPNRDGTKGTGGCSYCNNKTFNPAYCEPEISITEQISEGKRFFSGKYPDMKYLAYFQAYTNTYGELSSLTKLYEEAITASDVVGIIIATRPDCVSDELLNYLEQLAKRTFVMIEYGVETSHDRTLAIVNRGHTWAEVVDVATRTHAHGILCGAHLILGLPGETNDDFIATAKAISSLPFATVKLHQLQVVKGTRLATQFESGEIEIRHWNAEEYIDVCLDFLRHLSPKIAVERFVSQSPDGLLIYPRWGLKNYQFTNLLNNRIKATHTRQGSAICNK